MHLVRKPISATTVLGTVLLWGVATSSVAQTVYVQKYPVYVEAGQSLVSDPDGAIWFSLNNSINRVTTFGAETTFDFGPTNINYRNVGSPLLGPDGAFWFTVFRPPAIGRITEDGAITTFALPDPNSSPYAIVLGPDNALWFGESTPSYPAGSKIGRITTSGQVSEFALPGNTSPYGLATGPDGALWFTDFLGNAIGRMNVNGVITQYPLSPAMFPGTIGPTNIIAGPDGAMWFAQIANQPIPIPLGRITMSGSISGYPLPFGVGAITAGNDGALWFGTNGALVRMSMTGTTTSYPVQGSLGPLTVGPDGAFWSSDAWGNLTRMAVLDSPDISKPVTHVEVLAPVQPVLGFTVRWTGIDTGSGLRDLTIYVSEDGGGFTPWLTQTTAASATFYALAAGHTYAFFSIGRDWVGNVEDMKFQAEATTQTALQVTGDLNGDGMVNCDDLNLIRAAFGTRAGQPGFDPRADVNHDGVIDVRDLAWEAQLLPPNSHCQ